MAAAFLPVTPTNLGADLSPDVGAISSAHNDGVLKIDEGEAPDGG